MEIVLDFYIKRCYSFRRYIDILNKFKQKTMLEHFLKTGKISEDLTLLKEDFFINNHIQYIEGEIINFFEVFLEYDLKSSGVAQSFLVKKDSNIYANITYTKIEENKVRVTVVTF